MSKLIVLLSGGLDSVVSLAKVRNEYTSILALTFNYGQKSFDSEKKAAEKISGYYGIEHKNIDLNWLGEISNSAMNTSASLPDIKPDELDNKNIAQKTANAVWVPNRNGLFVNIAACYADAYGYDEILTGANKEEGATFKDNTPEFISAVNKALENSVEKRVKLIAPLIDCTKQDIVKIGIDLNVPFNLIYSCYVSGEKHCGMCESCRRLKRALELNNRHDIVLELFEQADS